MTAWPSFRTQPASRPRRSQSEHVSWLFLHRFSDEGLELPHGLLIIREETIGLSFIAVHGHLVFDQLHEADAPDPVARQRRLDGGPGLRHDARPIEAGEVAIAHGASPGLDDPCGRFVAGTRPPR